MRVDIQCGCGAKLGVGYAVHLRTSRDEQAAAERLIEQFRRDHKLCRISKSAEGAAA